MSYQEEYKIPEEYLPYLTEKFYDALWAGLQCTFGKEIEGYDPYSQIPMVWNFSGTTGWNFAMQYACNEARAKELWEYYDSLAWYDSDRFDGIVEEELSRRFSKKTNCYLLQTMQEEELAEFLNGITQGWVQKPTKVQYRKKNIVIQDWRKWLKEEAE